MRKEVIAPVLVLLMLLAAGGYVVMNSEPADDGKGDAGDNSDDGEGNPIGLSDWDVYYVESGDDLPACGSATLGRLYYVASTAGFETCTSAGWDFVDLTGPAGPPGANGTDGADGQDGADGVNGTNGHDAMAVTSAEPSGTNCTDGGTKIEVGVDDDGDGALGSTEVDHVQYVCDGADGVNGTNGQDGADGVDGTNGQDGVDGADGSASANTLLTRVSSPTLEACSSGGRIMEQGLDNGDGGGTAQNGVLETGEIDYTTTYCSNFIVARMADINSGSGWGYANDITIMGTRLYFEANDGTSGLELWAHETTNDSTWRVADINSGSGSGSANDITVMGTRLYFEAYDGTSGYELWMMEIEHTITYS